MPTMRRRLASHAAAHAAPAAPVPQPRSISVGTRSSGSQGSCANDVRDQQMVKRSVEQRERRALAGAGQGRAIGQLLPALDVGGRQRAQRARHFPET